MIENVTLDDIDREVLYDPRPVGNQFDTNKGWKPPSEYGVITAFNERFIFVKFKTPTGWSGSKACYPINLSWVRGKMLRMSPADLADLALRDLEAAYGDQT